MKGQLTCHFLGFSVERSLIRPMHKLYEYALYNSHSKRTSMLHEPVET